MSEVIRFPSPSNKQRAPAPYQQTADEAYSRDLRTILDAYLAKPSPQRFDPRERSDVERVITDWGLDPRWREAPYSSLDVAVAQIALYRAQQQLPDFTIMKAGELLHARSRFSLPFSKVETLLRPVFLFKIDWALTGPGLSWPEAYFATWLPGYNVFVVTISQDTDEALGVEDLAIGWFNDNNLFERACRIAICRYWRAWTTSHSQPEWEAFVAEGCIDERTAMAWARAVRWTKW